MILNYNLNYGIVFNNEFFVGYTGTVSVKQSRTIFFPESYQLQYATVRLKLAFMSLWIGLIIITTLFELYNLTIKAIRLLKYKHNDFKLIDFLNVVQIVNGVVVFSIYFSVFFGAKYHYQFKVPLVTED